jgi:hypothetical protein
LRVGHNAFCKRVSIPVEFGLRITNTQEKALLYDTASTLTAPRVVSH